MLLSIALVLLTIVFLFWKIRSMRSEILRLRYRLNWHIKEEENALSALHKLAQGK